MINSIDALLARSDGEPSHPRLREWKQRITHGVLSSLEIYRPPAMVGLSRTKMFLHFEENGTQQPLEEFDWDEHLNEGLIHLGVRAVPSEQESERFALGLRDGLRSVEKEFGNGFFNAVLLDVIIESKLNHRA